MERKPSGRRKVKLEEEMLEIKQGLLLTIVVCRKCSGCRKVKVVDDRRGGIVAQLGDCPGCGASTGDQLSPMDDTSPPSNKVISAAKASTEKDHEKPPPESKIAPSAKTVTFQRPPSPPGPPEPIVCRVCKLDPCIFTRLESDILAHDTAVNTVNNLPSDPMGGVVRNRMRRNRAYHFCAYRLYGYLGSGNRKKFPRCIEEGVRCLFPAYNGLHVGYQDARTG